MSIIVTTEYIYHSSPGRLDRLVKSRLSFCQRIPSRLLPIPTFSSIPSCESFGNRQLVCASCVPKLKLSSPRARIVFSQGQVAALPGALCFFHCRSSWPPTDLSERIVHFAQEVCHLVAFQSYAACLCIICSQTQTAASTRKSCLLMEAGCCPSAAVVSRCCCNNRHRGRCCPAA